MTKAEQLDAELDWLRKQFASASAVADSIRAKKRKYPELVVAADEVHGRLLRAIARNIESGKKTRER